MSVTKVQGVAYAGTVAQTNMTFTLSTNPIVGNVLIVSVLYYTGDSPFLVPVGWVLQRKDESGQVGIAIISRIVQTGDGTSWNLTVLSVADQNSGFMYEFSGCAGAFINASGNFINTTSQTTNVGASVTPRVMNCLAISFGVTIGSTVTGASVSAGWNIDLSAASTFQPAIAIIRTSLTIDNSSISNTISGFPSAQNGQTTILLASSTPSFRKLSTRPHPFSPGLAR